MRISQEVREHLRKIGKIGGKSRSERKMAASKINQTKAAAARRKSPTNHNQHIEIQESEAAYNE